jgi:hypothetical protein
MDYESIARELDAIARKIEDGAPLCSPATDSKAEGVRVAAQTVRDIAARNTECKSIAKVPAAHEPDPGSDPGPERAWIRVRGISVDQSNDCCDLHVHAVSLDTKPGDGTWREYVRADIARPTEEKSMNRGDGDA